MNKEKVLFVAKFLSEVHSHSLCPFYSNTQPIFWTELEETVSDKENVDKDFFIEMAKTLLKEIEKKEV